MIQQQGKIGRRQEEETHLKQELRILTQELMVQEQAVQKVGVEVENEERRTLNSESADKQRLMEKSEQIKKTTQELNQLQEHRDQLSHQLAQKEEQLGVCQAFLECFEQEIEEKAGNLAKETAAITDAILRVKRDTQAAEKENVDTTQRFYSEFKQATARCLH